MSSIAGLGIDMEDVARIEEMLARWGRAFATKIFSDSEILYCESKFHPAQHYAARFAAKEAFAKSLGTGWRGQFRWKDVEVRNDESGKPSIHVHGTLAAEVSQYQIHLSLSHTRAQVVAVVALERARDNYLENQ
ncbi:MAG: holo-ACP synthase [Ignavibacteriae bacterium]|nr:holo-ACP synthase [Ignavibacteriota bacterium]